MEIVDQVILPPTLEVGEYVVGFRWVRDQYPLRQSIPLTRCWQDCEESNQVWQSCGDVTIKAKAE